MIKQESNRINNYFYIILVVLIVLITIGSNMAKKQFIELGEDETRFIQIQQLMNAGRNQQAASLCSFLVKKYPDNYKIGWVYAVSLDRSNNNVEAVKQMVKTSEIRPAVLQDAGFLVQFGQVLFNAKQYDYAKEVFNAALFYAQNDTLKQVAQKQIYTIAKLNNGKGR